MIIYIYVYSPFILLPLNPHIFLSSLTHHAGLLVYFKPTPRLMNGRFRFFLKRDAILGQPIVQCTHSRWLPFPGSVSRPSRPSLCNWYLDVNHFQIQRKIEFMVSSTFTTTSSSSTSLTDYAGPQSARWCPPGDCSCLSMKQTTQIGTKRQKQPNWGQKWKKGHKQFSPGVIYFRYSWR